MARLLLVTSLLAVLASCGACDAYEPLDEPVPQVPLTTLSGEPVPLASFKGHPVVLHLWMPS